MQPIFQVNILCITLKLFLISIFEVNFAEMLRDLKNCLCLDDLRVFSSFFQSSTGLNRP